MLDYKVSQIITRHLNMSIIQTVQVYKNQFLSHKNMTLLEPRLSMTCQVQNYAFQLVADHSKLKPVATTEVNQPGGLCGWKRRKKKKKNKPHHQKKATTFTDKYYVPVW